MLYFLVLSCGAQAQVDSLPLPFFSIILDALYLGRGEIIGISSYVPIVVALGNYLIFR